MRAPTMSTTPFETLGSILEQDGPTKTFAALADELRREKKYPQLFEALLMRKRHELGLPLLGTDSFRDLPEGVQNELEAYYVLVCREVGELFLSSGDIAGAWPYFRAIDEPRLVAEAIERWEPPAADGSESSDVYGNSPTDTIIDIALNQGAHPRRGYELVLAHHGCCRAITIIEHQFQHPAEIKEACGAILIRRLHADLVHSLKHDIRRREGEAPEGSDIRKLLEERPWLFENHGYHMDLSHLQSGIRVSASLKDRGALELALEMTEYGRKLPRDFQNHDLPPFDDFYNDYRIFLQALLGIGVDGAIRYYTQKAERAQPEEDGKHFPGEILVHLLWRVGRYPEAIEAYKKHLAHFRGQLTAAPSLFELCDRAGDFTRLLELAKERGDLIHYTAGLIRQAGPRTSD